ncbi:HD domain-containing phosphohydrolase [Desulfoplanes sp.]
MKVSNPSLVNILIVDDDPQIREFIRDLLESFKYNCTDAASANEALEAFDQIEFDLVLCDIDLGGDDGLDLARSLREKRSDTAVIMVTGIDDSVLAETALDFGAYGYLVKPVRINEVLINVSNALRRRSLEMQNKRHQKALQEQVAERTRKLNRTLSDLRRAFDDIVHVIALTGEMKDAYTAGHQQRVAELASAIAREMGLAFETVETIRLAGMIHDLGKIAIPSDILAKPTRLRATEFELIKDHPRLGYDILSTVEYLKPVADIVLQHHERLDGRGYPQGLKGEKTLLEARIIAVADVVEAMSSHRPYREGLGIDIALGEIEKNAGILYDKDAAAACLRLFREKGFSLDK